jgi:hypothetical protein
MPAQEVGEFVDRPGTGDSLSSVCTNCFATVGPAVHQRDLRAAEAGHVCKQNPISLRIQESSDDQSLGESR